MIINIKLIINYFIIVYHILSYFVIPGLPHDSPISNNSTRDDRHTGTRGRCCGWSNGCAEVRGAWHDTDFNAFRRERHEKIVMLLNVAYVVIYVYIYTVCILYIYIYMYVYIYDYIYICKRHLNMWRAGQTARPRR